MLENHILENDKAKGPESSKDTDIVKEQTASLPDKVTDMNFLEQFTGGKSDKMHKYIGMFLDNAPRLLENIEQGLLKKDYSQIKVAAHSLKPQLSYMGVKEDINHVVLIAASSSKAFSQTIFRFSASWGSRS